MNFRCGETPRLKRKTKCAVLAVCILYLILSEYDYIIYKTNPVITFVRRQANNAQYVVKKSTILHRVKTKYDFVAFKKKPGWNFVVFPCHYICRKFAADVTVRYATDATEVVGADAVFFSTGPMELEEWEALHRYRSPGQVWVFATQEPASIVPDFLPPKVYRHISYNWSFTFHSTSDLHGAYGWYTLYAKPLASSDQISWFKQKPKFASWVSSRHCGGLGWDRNKFVKDLGNFIPIEMYGECGNLTLQRNTDVAKRTLRRYKFHLSLENSCCSEYLSEKVWNALQKWESVPIVLGGTKEDYKRLMPPNSYIHGDDFNSIEELAKYLMLVGRNETLYNKYFEWRNNGTVKQQSFSHRFPVFQEGVCKAVDMFERSKGNLSVKSFDPYGPNWFGSCYRCGEHDWIQDYNFWWRRTIFSKPWEDNRTLHWQNRKENNIRMLNKNLIPTNNALSNRI